MDQPSESDFEALFHRVSNAFVKRWEAFFNSDAVGLLRYLRNHESDLRCRIYVLYVLAGSGTLAIVDYDLIDFVASSLKTQNLVAVAYTQQDWYGRLLDREAMRKTIKHAHHFYVSRRLTSAAGLCRIEGTSWSSEIMRKLCE